MTNASRADLPLSPSGVRDFHRTASEGADRPLDSIGTIEASRDLTGSAKPRRGARELFRAIFEHARVQVVCGLVVAIVLPAVGRWGPSLFGDVSTVRDNALGTLIGASAALIVGFLALRQIRSFPEVNSAAYVFWAFAASYGTFALVLLITRIEYSRYLLIACFTLSLLWFLFIHHTVVRNSPMRLAVVPSPGVGVLPQTKRVVWEWLEQPRLSEPVGGVVADLKADHAPQWQAFLTHSALQGLPIFDVKHVSESLTGRVEIEHLSENTLAYRVHATAYRKAKRAIDTAAVVALSPLIVVVLAVAGLLVMLESTGPVIFAQMRMGHRGLPFRVLKLRTMYDRAEAGNHFTGKDDPRVTGVGQFLRKYRIDELPQALNILRGEMSWIGPRPETVELAQAYEREAPFYSYRHIVRPGISGWAQVNQGNVAGVEEAKLKLQYDFFYLKNLSPWLDMVIVIKTIRTVLTGFGAR